MLAIGKIDLRLKGLKKYLQNIKDAKCETQVGIFEEASYSDGTPVAYVGYLNEYGGHNPPRPFLKRTAEKQQNRWSKIFQGVLRSQGIKESSIHTAFERVGQTASKDVVKTIKAWSPNDPRPNKPATIAAKARKSAGAKGKNQQGNDPTRVLHDTGVMMNSITYKVEHK